MSRSRLHPSSWRLGAAATAAVVAVTVAGRVQPAAAAPSAENPAASAAATAVVQRAAAAWHADVSGILAYKAMTISDIAGGPVHHHEEQTVGYVEQNGVVTHKRVISDVKDGGAFSQADLDRMSAGPEDAISRTGLKLPYKPDSVGDYQYTLVAPHDGVQTVHFQPKIRDESHGTGDLSVDESGHVTHVTVQLAAVKRPATSGMLVITFGDVLNGTTRGVTVIERHFTGKAFFITGHGDEKSTYKSYERFSSEHDAQAALAAMTAS